MASRSLANRNYSEHTHFYLQYIINVALEGSFEYDAVYFRPSPFNESLFTLVDDLCHSPEEGREQLIDHTNVNDRLIDNQQPQTSSAISAVFEVL